MEKLMSDAVNCLLCDEAKVFENTWDTYSQLKALSGIDSNNQ